RHVHDRLDGDLEGYAAARHPWIGRRALCARIAGIDSQNRQRGTIAERRATLAHRGRPGLVGRPVGGRGVGGGLRSTVWDFYRCANLSTLVRLVDKGTLRNGGHG